MEYRAFFSYSRQDDKAADWLHRRLDGYRTPKELIGTQSDRGVVPAKLFPIFRDRTDMSGGGQLTDRIEQALSGSETLIVLCSPAAAASPWVDREVETFIGLGREHSIFPVIAPDAPITDDVERDFFPPALRGRGLLAADLRDSRTDSGGIVGDGRDGGRLKLIAGMLGVPLDQLARRERRRQQRLVSGLVVSLAIFAVLAVVATLSTMSANQRRIEAADNLAEARRIQSRFLSDLSNEALTEGRVTDSIALALEAMPNGRAEWPYVPVAERALYNAVLTAETTPLRSVRTMRGHGDAVTGGVHSHGGEWFLTWSADWTARLWNAHDGAAAAVFRHEGPVRGALFTPDETRVLTWSSDGEARLWSSPDGELIERFRHEGYVLGASLSEDAATLLTYSADGSVRLWSIEDGRELLRLDHQGGLLGADFVLNDRRIATWTWEGRLSVWDPATGEREHSVWTRTPLESVAVSDEGSSALVASSRVERWDFSQGSLDLVEERGMSAFSYEPSTERFLIVDGQSSAFVQDAVSGETLAEIEHDRPVRNGAFSNAGDQVVTWSTDGAIKIKTLGPEGGEVDLQTGSRVIGADFLEDGNRIVAWTADGQLQVWDIETRQMIGHARHEAHIEGVAIEDSARRLVSWSTDGEVHLWELPSRSYWSQIGKPETARAVRFTDDDRFVVKCGPGSDARLYEASTLEEVRVATFPGELTYCGFSGDGSYVVGISGGVGITAWNVETGDMAVTVSAQSSVRRIAHSNKGAKAAVLDANGTLELWDLENGTSLGRREGAGENATLVVLGHERDRLMLAPESGPVLLLDWEGKEINRIGDEQVLKVHTLSTDQSHVVLLEDGLRVLVVEAATGETVSRTTFASPVLRANVSADGSRIVVRTEAKKAYVLDWRKKKKPREVDDPRSVEGVQISPNGDLIATVDGTGDFWLWRGGFEKPFVRIATPGRKPRLWFEESGRWFVGYSATRLTVYDLQEDRIVYQVDSHESFDPINYRLPHNRLFLKSSQGTLVVVDLIRGVKVLDYVVSGASDLAMSPGDTYVYSRAANTALPVLASPSALLERGHGIVESDDSLSNRERCRAFIEDACASDPHVPMHRQSLDMQTYMEGQVGNLVDVVSGGSDETPLDVEISLSDTGAIRFHHSLPFRGSVRRLEVHGSEREVVLVMDDGQRRNMGLPIIGSIVRGTSHVAHATIVHLVEPGKVDKDDFQDHRVVRVRDNEWYVRTLYTVPVVVRE